MRFFKQLTINIKQLASNSTNANYNADRMRIECERTLKHIYINKIFGQWPNIHIPIHDDLKSKHFFNYRLNYAYAQPHTYVPHTN